MQLWKFEIENAALHNWNSFEIELDDPALKIWNWKCSFAKLELKIDLKLKMQLCRIEIDLKLNLMMQLWKIEIENAALHKSNRFEIKFDDAVLKNWK